MVIISVSDLSIVFDGLSIRNAFNLPRRERFEALKINNMEIGNGEIVAVLGHNGAGKSTLLNTIAGKIRPKRGKVKLPRFGQFSSFNLKFLRQIKSIVKMKKVKW